MFDLSVKLLFYLVEVPFQGVDRRMQTPDLVFQIVVLPCYGDSFALCTLRLGIIEERYDASHTASVVSVFLGLILCSMWDDMPKSDPLALDKCNTA